MGADVDKNGSGFFESENNSILIIDGKG